MTLDPPFQSLMQRVRAATEEYDPDGWHAPATEEEIAALVERSLRVLGVTLPQAYLDFLRLTNGMAFDGLVIYDTHSTPQARRTKHFWQGYVETNLMWRDVPENEAFLIFGDTDLDLLVQERATGLYWHMDRSCGDLVDSFATFEAMLASPFENRLS